MVFLINKNTTIEKIIEHLDLALSGCRPIRTVLKNKFGKTCSVELCNTMGDVEVEWENGLDEIYVPAVCDNAKGIKDAEWLTFRKAARRVMKVLL